MKKSILNLSGVQELTKKQKSSINGGIKLNCGAVCTSNRQCISNACELTESGVAYCKC